MNDKDRKAETQLPPPPESPSDMQAGSTMPPAEGGPPSVLEPEAVTETDASAAPLKGAAREPSEFFERAYNELVRVHKEQGERDRELYDEDGKFAGLLGGIIDKSLTGFALKLEPRFKGIEAKISKQGEVIYELEQALKKHREDSDAKFADLERQISDLKEQRTEGAAATPAG